MRRGSWLVALSVVALAMHPVAMAAAGPPAPRREAQQPNTGGLVYLGKAGGYEIGISNPDPHVAFLYVDRFGRGQSAETYAQAAYAVRPSSSLASGVLRARFGTIGRIALRFQPGGKVKVGRRAKHCRGPRPQTEFGVYRGSVSLRGEGGYFHLRTRAAPGTRSRTFRLSCFHGQAHQVQRKALYEYVFPSEGFITTNGAGNIALLRAVSEAGGRYVSLRASHFQGSGPGADVRASTLEQQPGMAIGRAVEVNGEAGTLLTSLPGQRPATATLAPPAPFHGKAEYAENSATSHRWTGTLAVSLPGLEVPLTGAGFATSLCVLSPFKARLPCDFRNTPVVPE